MSDVPESVGPPPQDGADSGVAASKVKGPAIALMVIAILGTLWNLWSMVSFFLFAGARQAAMQEQAAQMEGMEGMEGFDPQMIMNIAQTMGPVSLVFNLLAIAIGVVILLGALKMQKLESHGFAMTASILAMIPCVSPCCLLGLPFGIWAIVVLNNAEVKSAFQ